MARPMRLSLPDDCDSKQTVNPATVGVLIAPFHVDLAVFNFSLNISSRIS
jgi:hypothetical protein